MLRVEIVSATTVVPDSGTVTRLMTTIEALRAQDHVDVHVTALESLRHLRSRSALERRRAAIAAREASISFWPVAPQRLPGRRRTMVGAAALVLAPVLRSRRPEMIVALNADAGAACSLVATGRSIPASHVFEMHGIESEEAIFAGSVRRDSPEHDQRARIEAAALDWADDVVAPTPEACAWGRSRSTGPRRWHDLPTLSPLRLEPAEAAQLRTESRRRLGWEGNKVLLYVGGMNEWQQPEQMASVFAALRAIDRGWRFLVLTPEPQRASEVLRGAGLDDADYRAFSVDHREVAEHGAGGDMALLLRQDHLMNTVASPTKFGEYLEMGVPVCVTTALPGMAELTAREAVGISVESDIPAPECATRIEGFLTGSDRAGLVDRCRAAARDHFSSERAEALYATIVDEARRRRERSH